MISIAVLITCHNRKQKTIKCLQALFNQHHIENVKTKVFLVDDGSTDGTKQAINELFPDVTVIEGTGNLYWARGMSLAWQEALKSTEKFDYYLWLNDDTCLINTAIKELLKTQRNATEIINGSVCDPVTKRRTYGGTKFTNKFLTPFRYKVVDINGEPQEIDTINGNVVLIPHSVYTKIGGIDNHFEHAFADMEYSLRAVKNNIKILLTAKHIAECERKTLDYETNSKLSLFKKISNLFDRKVKPPRSWFRICYKYGGVLWPLHFFIGYAKDIIKILFYQNKNRITKEMKDILCVTYPIDMGNITHEKNLKYLFSQKMDFFSYASKNNLGISRFFKHRSFPHKLLSALSLRKVLKKYSNKNKKIIFNAIGPAIWGYGAYKVENSILMTDWTRSLWEFVLKKKIKKDLVYNLQSFILKKIPKILCRTDVIMEHLSVCYGVKDHQMKKIIAPLVTSFFDIHPRSTPNRPRVLFIGDDFIRKGGDIIINNLDLILPKFNLTMISKDKKANVKGVNYINSIDGYATTSHKKIFHDHDILILPSRFDPYGMVIAEAASAGVAIITTKFTFSSKNLIPNETLGIIVDEPKDCIPALLQMAENPTLIDKFKNNIYKQTHLNFSETKIYEQFMKNIY